MTLGLTISQVGLPYSLLNTVVLIPLCVNLGVCTLRIFYQIATIVQNSQSDLVPEIYMCAPLKLQFLEIFHSGTSKFTLYMCIYIVARNGTFLKF